MLPIKFGEWGTKHCLLLFKLAIILMLIDNLYFSQVKQTRGPRPGTVSDGKGNLPEDLPPRKKKKSKQIIKQVKQTRGPRAGTVTDGNENLPADPPPRKKKKANK